MVYRLLTTLALLAVAVPAAAEPVELSSQAIRTTLAGSLVNMDSPAGTIIPVRFGTDGLVSGEAGVLAPVLGAKRDRGRWWAEGDKLCMKWFRWFEAEKRCVTLSIEGERLYWRGEDRNGTATIVGRAPVVVASAPEPAPQVPEKAAAERVAPALETSAQAAPAHVEMTAIAAPADPAPTVMETQKPEIGTSNDRAERLALRFAAASLGPMSFAGPLREPDKLQHLLDAPEREAISAGPSKTQEQAPSGDQTAPVPQAKVTQSKEAKDVDAKVPHGGGAQASSTVVLASFKVARVDADDLLNVRSGPAIFYPSVGSLLPEEHGVKIVGPCRSDWCPIRHGRMTGWVNRYFLAEDTVGPATTTVSR